ncbi:MAG: DUF58 domain-containing protein [Acidobacteria bacterium]|nr:DUF58 domain-containing protein [Acidobacteriota bacterium]
MIDRELFRKVRQIEITTGRLVDDALAGEYHSVFKGQGMEYEEVRPYQPGDDIRTIDWNVTSRSGTLHVKKYVEERELTVILLVDCSRSTRFGTGMKSKAEVAAEIAAILAFSAIRNNDRVGAVLFTGEVEKYIPPRKGTRHVLRLVREILAYDARRRDTDLRGALEFIVRVMKKRCIVFMISDFFDADFEQTLRLTARKHDIVAVSTNDRGEMNLPRSAWVQFEDMETGKVSWMPTFVPRVRARYREKMMSFRQQRTALFHRHKVDHVEIFADEPYDKPLIKFFQRRAQRQRH